MSLTSADLTWPLRRAGYFVAIATISAQVVELGLRSWPFRFHSAAWRISLVGNIANVVLAMLLMTFIVLVIATLVGDRLFALTVTGFSIVAAICLLILDGVFALDAIQIRNQIQVSSSRAYDTTAAWVLVRALMALVGFVMLAVGGLRSATAMRRQTSRLTPKSGNLIVGSTRPAPTPQPDEVATVKGG